MSFLSLLGITTAYAETTAATTGAPASQGFMSMLPIFVILILFMYFIVIRPQSKRAKEQRNLLSNLQKGDEVMTSGGLLGKIAKIEDNFIILNIATGVDITVQKAAVVASVPKGTIKSV